MSKSIGLGNKSLLGAAILLQDMSTENETWKDITGWERYQVSNLGKVKRKAFTRPSNMLYCDIDRMPERNIKSNMNNNGYMLVILHSERGYQNFTVHRLVAKMFVPNPENKPQVNHKNGIKTDCRAVNLEWCTASENLWHRYNVLKQRQKGGHYKLTEVQVLEIRKSSLPPKKLGDRYRISPQQIRAIRKRRTWKHI